MPSNFRTVAGSQPSVRLMSKVKIGCEHCHALLMMGPASLSPMIKKAWLEKTHKPMIKISAQSFRNGTRVPSRHNASANNVGPETPSRINAKSIGLNFSAPSFPTTEPPPNITCTKMRAPWTSHSEGAREHWGADVAMRSKGLVTGIPYRYPLAIKSSHKACIFRLHDRATIKFVSAQIDHDAPCSLFSAFYVVARNCNHKP